MQNAKRALLRQYRLVQSAIKLQDAELRRRCDYPHIGMARVKALASPVVVPIILFMA